MIPMQVYNTLQEPEEREKLMGIKHLIIGGGAIDDALATELKDFPNHVWSTYGMTETLSHIALRAANGPQRSNWYMPLPGVSLSLSQAGTLQITAPYVRIHHLETNDLAEIGANASFRILGRVDAVINSGGIKIQAEELERTLHRLTGLQVLALPLPHPVLGQCVALLWEGSAAAESALHAACDTLPKYHRPHLVKRVILPRTTSGKIARKQAAALLAD